MAVGTFIINSQTDNATEWRQLSQVGVAIVAAGWVRCADSGQINWTTTVFPGVGLSAGYEIFRMADTLQATAPVFLRIDYAYGASLTKPALWVRVGTSTDGAGELNSEARSVLLLLKAGSIGQNADITARWSGSTNRFAIAFPTEWKLFFSIERFKSLLGADTGDGVILTGGCPGTGIVVGQAVLTTSPSVIIHPIRAKAPVLLPDDANWQNGSVVGLSPVIPLGKSLLNPLTDTVAYLNADITATNQVSLTMYGTARNYYALGDTCATSLFVTTLGRVLMRYD